MKKIIKTAAVLLGWSSCVAQAAKCPGQSVADPAPIDPGQTESVEPPTSLDRLQNLDKIYAL